MGLESMMERIRTQSDKAYKYNPEAIVVSLAVIESIAKDYKE